MTLAQFLSVCRNRHNAASDTYWSDQEIYDLTTNRCNEVLSVIGLLEDTDTSHVTIASTQEYAYPSDAATIRQVNYKNNRLKRITFREWQGYRNEDTDQEGRPECFLVWNREVLLVPIPDTAGEQITIYYYKEHPYIDGVAQTTIDIPSVLHPHLVNGVVADMYAKDENANMAQMYEDKWLRVSYPAFQRFKSNEDDAGQFQITADADTMDVVDGGLV